MLLEQINLFSDNDVLWIYKKRQIRAKDLKSFIGHSYIQRNLIKGKKVAIYLSNPLEIAYAFCFLDGIAESILLLPFEQKACDISKFISQTECSYVLTDNTNFAQQIHSDISIMLIENLGKENKKIVYDPIETIENKLDSKWIIPTSGTTGVPKLVSHSIVSLTRSVRRNREIGQMYTWGLLYGLMRFAGLQVFLQCLYSGSTLVLPQENETTDESLRELAITKCNALSATPTMWRKILMLKDHKALKLKQITLGGEAVDQQILNALSKAYPESRITHIYASTEAGVGFAVIDGKEGFPESYVTEYSTSTEIRVDEQGFLLIKPPHSKQSYIGLSEDIEQTDGFINTGDIVTLKDNRYLFLGRANGTINVGGNKVQPEEVEKVLRSFQGVKLASVYAKSSPIMGDLVGADIVIEDGIEDEKLFKNKLIAFCKTQLVNFKVPAVVKITDDIKTNHTGKIVRS